MKILSTCGFILSIISVCITVFITGIDPQIRKQAFALDFPLTSMGEGIMVMVVPMFLLILATLLCLIAWKRKYARLGIAISTLGWLLIWIILGKEGFQYLF